MRQSRILHTVILCLLCTGCIPPRERAAPRDEPWQHYTTANGDVRSGFETFVWSTEPLKEGHKTVTYGGGFPGFSGRTPDVSSRKSATYYFIPGDPRTPSADQLTYEVQEINKCIEDTSIERVWAAIASTGRVSGEDSRDPTYGRVKRYERALLTAQPATRQLEAGLILGYRSRIYVLRVLQRRGSQSEAEDFEQAFKRVKEKREKLLGSIAFAPGKFGMCHVIATEP